MILIKGEAVILPKPIGCKNLNINPSFFDLVCKIIERKHYERSGERRSSYEEQLIIGLKLDLDYRNDSYTVLKCLDGIEITSGTRAGLLAGVGRFLRNGCFGKDGFTPGEFIGFEQPEKPVRGMYFATHFHNYYHEAPLEKIYETIEDLSLWGLNALMLWYDMHDYSAINDKCSLEMIERLKQIIKHAEKLGMKTALTVIANESFAGTPEEIKADWQANGDYSRNLVAHYHIEICPSKQGGMEQILINRRGMLAAFSDVNPSYIVIWPYDPGGCTCRQCSPWGTSGFYKTAKAVSKLVKEYMPDTEIILSAWLFDSFINGEWDLLSDIFKKENGDWVKYIMANFQHKESTRQFIAEHAVFVKKDLLSFPEISMAGAVPWGGFGANPMPARIQKEWDETGLFFEGGFPYSEGIFEDINKVLMLSLYSGCYTNTADALLAYIKFEISDIYAQEIAGIIVLMENSLPRSRIDEKGAVHDYPDKSIPWVGEQRFVIKNTHYIEEIFKRTIEINQKLSRCVQESWRWKIIYLRALIDHELFNNEFKISNKCEEYLQTLTGIYYAGNGDYCVSPPTRHAIEENRGGFSW